MAAKYQKWTTIRNYLILMIACNSKANSKAQMQNIRRQIEEARANGELMNDYNAELLKLASKIELGGLDK